MSFSTVPTQASALKIGGYMCINDRPCRILDKKESITGKHGGKKIHFFTTDIFTDQKYEYLEMSTKNIDVPDVSKNEYQLVDIENNIVSYFDRLGKLLNDLVLPHSCDKDIELARELVNEFKSDKEIYINVLSSMGEREIKGFRVSS